MRGEGLDARGQRRAGPTAPSAAVCLLALLLGGGCLQASRAHAGEIVECRDASGLVRATNAGCRADETTVSSFPARGRAGVRRAPGPGDSGRPGARLPGDALGSPRISAAGAFAAPSVGGKRVFVFLRPELLAEIDATLGRFLESMAQDGYAPQLQVRDWRSEAELKALLVAERDRGLEGALLLGDLPFARVRRKPSGEPRPCPLYYMDLDGEWEKDPKDGTYVGYPSVPAIFPEIWAGVIHTHSLDGDPAEHVRRYLERVIRYRAGERAGGKTALMFIDDQWARPNKPQTAGLEHIYGPDRVRVLRARSETTAQRLREELAQDLDFLHVVAHGNPASGIYLAQEGGSELVSSAQIRTIAPKPRFYNFGNCSLCLFTQRNYAGGWFVFGPGNGLAALGTTMNGMMLDSPLYYKDLAQGKSFGEALKDWYRREAIRDKTVTDRRWYLGVVHLGDASLRLR